MTDPTDRLTLLHPLRMVDTMSSSIAHTVATVADTSSATSGMSVVDFLMMVLFIGALIGFFSKALGVVNKLASHDGGDRPGSATTWLWLVGLVVAVAFSTPETRPWMRWLAFLAGYLLIMCSAGLWAYRRLSNRGTGPGHAGQC